MLQPDFTFKNRLLAALPPEDIQLLRPHLQFVELQQKRIIYDVGDAFQNIYFIEQGVISVLTAMEDGATIEVGMVGLEGVAPIAAFLGENTSDQHSVVQLPGSAYRINITHCRAAFEQSPTFRKVILQFTNLFLNLSGQTAACNRLHSVQQRLARWLLMSSDRFQSDEVPLTQEYISSMLGVRRVGVTESAGDLQRSGLIRYNHGHITILDRKGLEKIACECYRLDHERFKATAVS